MFLSIFDVFKIGVGPSSSHTMGPMRAALLFLETLRAADTPEETRVGCSLHGSLAFTGKGHATDRAVILGLLGCDPETLDLDRADDMLSRVADTRRLEAPGLPLLRFDPDTDLIFDYGPPLPGHANGMKLWAIANGVEIAAQTYYSIGGGFIATEEELAGTGAPSSGDARRPCPYPFNSAAEMLRMGDEAGLSIAEMKLANETNMGAGDDVMGGVDRIWSIMTACVDRGMAQDGELPGGLRIRRRAKSIREQLVEEWGRNDSPPHLVNDWLSLYAMAVNEENAAGGRVVTAPTNGAAGVIPAVGRYYLDHCPGASHDGLRAYLLTAAAIGGIIKHNASISGAEVGCQGEVGSAAAMAAAGLCAALGGTNMQIENAAEIALEHHLGMTCDPIAGLVQAPCIERNGLGAVKAVTAASLALKGDGVHFVPLDDCIETMRQTGLDMNEKYKETSTGGLAVNVVEC